MIYVYDYNLSMMLSHRLQSIKIKMFLLSENTDNAFLLTTLWLSKTCLRRPFILIILCILFLQQRRHILLGTAFARPQPPSIRMIWTFPYLEKKLLFYKFQYGTKINVLVFAIFAHSGYNMDLWSYRLEFTQLNKCSMRLGPPHFHM